MRMEKIYACSTEGKEKTQINLCVHLRTQKQYAMKSTKVKEEEPAKWTCQTFAVSET